MKVLAYLDESDVDYAIESTMEAYVSSPNPNIKEIIKDSFSSELPDVSINAVKQEISNRFIKMAEDILHEQLFKHLWDS